MRLAPIPPRVSRGRECAVLNPALRTCSQAEVAGLITEQKARHDRHHDESNENGNHCARVRSRNSAAAQQDMPITILNRLPSMFTQGEDKPTAVVARSSYDFIGVPSILTLYAFEVGASDKKASIVLD